MGQYKQREMEAAVAKPVLFCVNESNAAEVSAHSPQKLPHCSFDPNEIEGSPREASVLI